MRTYRNPILPGFYPDPSICRVGEEFYLVNSSFEYFPGVPIFRSRDLVHWEQLGHVLTRESQLPLDGIPSSSGIWAPTLRHHDGRFYLIVTFMRASGRPVHLFLSADRAEGPWSDPAVIEEPGHGIDPSLFFDDDGRVYLTTHGSTSGDESDSGLVQCEFDPRVGTVIGETRMLWRGTGGICAEGPHLYKIDGRYYLLAAEGGTSYGHMVTIARSDSPWGPFESCPHNPVLSNRSVGRGVNATGHGDLVQDVAGRWWMVHLGIRPVNCHHALGRETFLAPVTWEDGWPRAGVGGATLLEMQGELPPECPVSAPPSRDDFDETSLAHRWNFRGLPAEGSWSLSDRPGHLRLTGTAATLDDVARLAWVGLRQRSHDATYRASLSFEPTNDREQAGLTVCMNEQYHYDLIVGLRDGRRCAWLRRRVASLIVEGDPVPLSAGDLVLTVGATQHEYGFAVQGADGCVHELGCGEAHLLSSESAQTFTGVYIAMFATGHGASADAPADFDWFTFEERI